MYETTNFRVEDKAEMIALIRDYPLGLIIAPRSDQSFFASADLVPFVVDDEGQILRAHIVRANPLAMALDEPRRVLVVFQGPHGYISPAHYPSKKAHGRVVPTWNYIMVQAEGVARLRDDPEWIAKQIEALTTQQEQTRADAWKVGDAPEVFIAAQMRAIIGVEIEISSLRGKYKLSQNRSDVDRKGVIAGLAAEGSPATNALAQFMAAREEPETLG